MTKNDTAAVIAAAYAIVQDAKKSKKVRREALDTIVECYPEGKAPAKITALYDLLGEARAPGVCDYIRDLLLDETLSYQEIVDMAREKFPDSKPTKKSAQSLARDMRKAGTPVVHRTVKAQPKIDGRMPSLDDLLGSDEEEGDDAE